LYQTEPSGAFNDWKANAIGRNAQNLREYLEKHWKAGMSEEETIKLAVQTLLEIVESSENMELCLIKKDSIKTMEQDALDSLVTTLKKEKEAHEASKK
jgi:20S proteasome subunit alpha 4